MSEIRTPVLIVGGALTGLSTAVFLAWHGVPVLLVERHPDLLIHPRLRGIKARTVELYRQVGLEDAIKQASFATGQAYEWHAVTADTLDGEHTPAEEPPPEEMAGSPSPSEFGPIDQDRLEVLLRERATELGAELRFSTELTAFEQDEDGVTATLTDRNTGTESTVRADYLVAADGVASPVRERLGVAADGPGLLFHTITAIVAADLNPALRGRKVDIAYVQKPQPFTILMGHDDAGKRWVFGTGYSPDHQSPSDFTDEQVAELVRAAAGLPDVDVTLHPQVPGTDIKVMGFPVGAQLARSYRVGRVFLAGDAAHLMPPTGGFGGSTGVQDAHNLAWKLAAVVQGYAGPELLDTYEAERRPVGALTMGQALARFGVRMGPAESEPMIEESALVFGYRYSSPAVPAAPEGDLPPLSPGELNGQPGTRAPHLTVTRNGSEISTIDLYDRHFVLLVGSEGAAWLAAAAQVAEQLNVPLDAYRFGVELTGADGEAKHGIGPTGALLVRPDGYVAWRTQKGTKEDLRGALKRILAR